LIKAKNDAQSFELAKMVEEAKILSMPLTGMDAWIKSWYMMIRDRIGKEMMTAQEPPMVPPLMEEPKVEEVVSPAI
jgi:hypothetical protein